MLWLFGRWLIFTNLFRFVINGLEFIEFGQGLLSMFVWLLNDLLDLVGISFWVVYNFVIYLLVATFAQATWVMSAILVLAFSGLLLVAFVKVAEVAHKFGFMPAVVVLTYGHASEWAKNFNKALLGLVFILYYEVTLLIAVLPYELKPLGNHCLWVVTLLHLSLFLALVHMFALLTIIMITTVFNGLRIFLNQLFYFDNAVFFSHISWIRNLRWLDFDTDWLLRLWHQVNEWACFVAHSLWWCLGLSQICQWWLCWVIFLNIFNMRWFRKQLLLVHINWERIHLWC